MISVQSAYLSFIHENSAKQVLQDISFRVKPYESCAIIGPSGCGKTSLLFLLAGLLVADCGEVKIADGFRSGTILQNYGLLPWKTVSQNIALGLVLRGEKKRTTDQCVDRLLDELGLSGFDSYYPGRLSGGMQQRVALARALAVEPEVLFMDEPLSSLDALTRERLQNLILDLWQKKRITMVLVTHSIEEAVFLGRKIIVLSKRPGRILKIVDNPEAGEVQYRLSDTFFHRCVALRQLLKGEYDGQET
jgi:NitT/TauT family transport system ATP-binding protein